MTLGIHLLDIFVMALPIAIYLIKRYGVNWRVWGSFAGCVVLAIAVYGFVICSFDSEWGEPSVVIVSIVARWVIWVAHWVSWLRMAGRGEAIGTRAFPLLTIWAMMLFQAIGLENGRLIRLAFVYLVFCTVIFTYIGKKRQPPEKTEEETTNF